MQLCWLFNIWIWQEFSPVRSLKRALFNSMCVLLCCCCFLRIQLNTVSIAHTHCSNGTAKIVANMSKREWVHLLRSPLTGFSPQATNNFSHQSHKKSTHTPPCMWIENAHFRMWNVWHGQTKCRTLFYSFSLSLPVINIFAAIFIFHISY